MRVLIDSSTLYSAIAFPRKENKMVKSLMEKHTIVVTDYIEEELKRNFEKTFSKDRKKDILFELDMFISECELKKVEEYEKYLEKAKKKISKKDSPILACSMLKDIDYLITSDNEFHEIKCDEVEILTPKKARDILI